MMCALGETSWDMGQPYTSIRTSWRILSYWFEENVLFFSPIADHNFLLCVVFQTASQNFRSREKEWSRHMPFSPYIQIMKSLCRRSLSSPADAATPSCHMN